MSSSLQQEQPSGHYHTTGNALISVGLINFVYAGFALTQDQQDSFISYDTMMIFALMMISMGGWMRSFKES